MKFIFDTEDLSAFTPETEIIDFSHPLVQKVIQEICSQTDSKEERAKLAFEYARDQIAHSFDLQSKVITIKASDAMEKGEGICFAKSHVLAALLRGMGIPSGFCYQRVMRKGTPESGYALHGLNAVYLEDRDLWIRVDPRGNKPGVHSEFGIEEEKLAYTIHTDQGEIDYPHIFSAPVQEVIDSMVESADCQELFSKRPERLPE